jgi:predicted O-methyltransferase YrrM
MNAKPSGPCAPARPADLPHGDYVSPGFAVITPDAAFPQLTIGNPANCPWPYLRREVPHNWYVDRRAPGIGFLSRDEALLLYNLALQFRGQRALEIGCWLGWSTCHLAAAGVELDVIDPILARADVLPIVQQSLAAAGVLPRVQLTPGVSPQGVTELAVRLQRTWSLLFIDGNHDAPSPLLDAQACAAHAAADALIVFHDLASPEVGEGLRFLAQQGWRVLIYQTMQVMGIAYRGSVTPVRHIPDPRVPWRLPEHLQGLPVSG